MQLTQALEWARYRIRVNVIAPGYVETDLDRDFFATDLGKALDGPLLLLASDASAYMTGSTILVDGGNLQSTL